MIGNDIIDINFTKEQSNWKRKGFLDKVFTKEEKYLIKNSECPFLSVWRMWSMKESAYKSHLQYHKKRFFNPKKLECFIQDTKKGYVIINQIKYLTHTIFESNYIYTTTNSSERGIKNCCFYIENTIIKNQQKEVYHQLKKMVSNKLTINYNELFIQKSIAGIPKLFVQDQEIDIQFSLTHHGHYGAVSIL
ncbi:4'-phosphopantetheinyl transferase family protein [Tenacibaculum agarivorans]|uniref:4'-phosphopantetheinyl transferase family protein n=1 Tax=Tenacibaculum agarivorans TaxID=1908389 RepID=UPI00094B826F|nr:4'-phosphopantetheinyl transferase superfamily protein [Tenacibaculum agarivorans]